MVVDRPRLVPLAAQPERPLQVGRSNPRHALVWVPAQNKRGGPKPGGRAHPGAQTQLGGQTLTPAQVACLKQALGASAFAQLIASGNPSSLTAAQQAKAMTCLVPAAAKPVPATGNWIVASPVDVTHVTMISKFRSCLGHDYSGYDVQGSLESDRSMKHYITADLPWTPPDVLDGYAPFDGTVTKITPEQAGYGEQLWVENANGWSLVFFHGDPLVDVGANVKAGQPIIQWPPKNALSAGIPLPPTLDFDLALVAEPQGLGGYELDSIFRHMTPGVSALWAARGFTAADAIISQAARDASPCNGNYNDHPEDEVLSSFDTGSRV